MKNETKILLVDDDLAARAVLAEGLSIDGFEVYGADNARLARHQIEHKQPDLVLLDLNLPDSSGYHLLREIRDADGIGWAVDPTIPVIVLSGRSGEVDRVRGFEFGCDDYIVKPFSFAELRGRVEAMLRRRGAGAAPTRLLGELTIDQRSRRVQLAGRPVSLTAKEYALLIALASEPGRVFTKEELLKSVWGFRSLGATRTLDSHACRLRAKLRGGKRRYIVNLWGTGYRLTDNEPGEVAA